MTGLSIMMPDTAKLMTLALGSVCGALIGVLHYAGLACTIRYFVGEATLLRAFAIQLMRWAVTGIALAIVSRFGAGPLLAATAGLLGARAVVIRGVCVQS